MVLAWAATEVVRYAFYALGLLGAEPRALAWLRYTTFYVLYPLGAGSEAFLIYATLPRTSPLPAGGVAPWTPAEYGRGALFVIWWPGESRRSSLPFARAHVARRPVRDVHVHDQAEAKGFGRWSETRREAENLVKGEGRQSAYDEETLDRQRDIYVPCSYLTSSQCTLRPRLYNSVPVM